MRLSRERSYGDLERGHTQCWKVYDKNIDKVAQMTEAISAAMEIDIADFCGEDGDGYSSEFIIDTNDRYELRQIYIRTKMYIHGTHLHTS